MGIKSMRVIAVRPCLQLTFEKGRFLTHTTRSLSVDLRHSGTRCPTNAVGRASACPVPLSSVLVHSQAHFP